MSSSSSDEEVFNDEDTTDFDMTTGKRMALPLTFSGPTGY